jgi:hypothetical protein
MSANTVSNPRNAKEQDPTKPRRGGRIPFNSNTRHHRSHAPCTMHLCYYPTMQRTHSPTKISTVTSRQRGRGHGFSGHASGASGSRNRASRCRIEECEGQARPNRSTTSQASGAIRLHRLGSTRLTLDAFSPLHYFSARRSACLLGAWSKDFFVQKPTTRRGG